MLFSKFRTTKVAYVVDRINSFDVPLGIVPNIEKYSNLVYQTKCPAVSMVHSRLYYANSYLDIDIEFGYRNDEPYYDYVFNENEHPVGKKMHTFIKEVIGVQPMKSNVHLQISSPYSFITDNKDIEIVTIPPYIECENCVYVPGGLKPYYWIRNLNAAFVLSDATKVGKIKLRVDKPMFFFYFNKPVDLKFTEQTEKIKSYIAQSHDIVNFRTGIEKYYMNVVSRRPKKLL